MDDILHYITQGSSLSFQCVVNYTKPNGDVMMRVCAKQLTINDEKENVEKTANFDIISTNAMQRAESLARRKSFTRAQAIPQIWGKYMEKEKRNYYSAYSNLILFNNNCNSFNKNLDLARKGMVHTSK